jgi:hypothetical protein
MQRGDGGGRPVHGPTAAACAALHAALWPLRLHSNPMPHAGGVLALFRWSKCPVIL